jgi:aryl-alcohol dehydrogenase-like predicted oxidoreductase
MEKTSFFPSYHERNSASRKNALSVYLMIENGYFTFLPFHLTMCVMNRKGWSAVKYTKLGNSDLNVSRICMGCMGFGDSKNGQHSWTLNEEASREIIRRGLDLGVNFFDTAIAYQSGTSEQYLGRALKDFVPRDKVVVATKFLPRTKEEIEAGVSGQEHIRRMLDKSLSNLGMDYVDLYIYHMWDYQTPLEEILEGLHQAVKAGKARYIGISNCFAWQLCKANALARQEGFTPFVSVQSHYNLIFREEEREMAPFCKEENIAMTPYSALAGGRLSKKPGELSKRLTEDAYAKLKYDSAKDQDAPVLARVAELADAKGVTMTEISLAWLLTKVTSPVVGATKLHHIEGAAKAVDLVLTEEECRYLEELYTPHPLVGVMAQNTAKPQEKPVWSTGNQKI